MRGYSTYTHVPWSVSGRRHVAPQTLRELGGEVVVNLAGDTVAYIDVLLAAAITLDIVADVYQLTIAREVRHCADRAGYRGTAPRSILLKLMVSQRHCPQCSNPYRYGSSSVICS